MDALAGPLMFAIGSLARGIPNPEHFPCFTLSTLLC
jgi:hypothetical protein